MNISISQLLTNSFVISINPKNLQRFYKIFSDNNLQPLPKHVEGIRLLNNNQLKKTNISSYLKKHLSAMITHRMIISMAKALNLPFVCIFEDDAIPRKSIQTMLADTLSDIPDQSDILILGNIHTFQTKQYNDKYIIPCKTYGLQSYIVFQPDYDYFLSMIDEDTTCGLGSYGKNVFLVKEQLFIQYESGKDSIAHLSGLYHFNYSKEFLNNEFLPVFKASVQG